MAYPISDIARIIGAEIPQDRDGPLVRHLAIDTRRIEYGPETLFFAFKGARHDGHQFVGQAWQQGVRYMVVTEPLTPPEQYPGLVLLRVADARQALQALAAFHRSHFQVPIVGITGSNGKTIVKEWLYQVLSPQRRIARSPGSYNSQVGVPLSVWTLDDGSELGIFEAGISEAGEMAALARIIRPTIGMFTNLGSAHATGFRDDAHKVAEKMALFADDTQVLIYRADYEAIHEAALAWEAAQPGRQRIAWSTGKVAQTIPVSFQHSAEKRSSHLVIGEYAVDIPFSDPASAENSTHVWLAARLITDQPEWLLQRMHTLAPIAMRLELKAGIRGCRLIDDAYSNDLSSLRVALHFARQQEPDAPLTVILSDMLSHDADPARLYQSVAALLRTYRTNRLIGVGPDMKRLQTLPIETHFYPDSHSLMADLPALGFQHEVVLLKGARIYELEKVAARLTLKSHRTTLEINLNAIIHNLHAYTRMLQPGVGVMAMVKAAGYGSGPVEIARLLEYHKVDYLGVAYTDEGVELREAGISCPIMVLNPDPTGFDDLSRHQLEPEVYSLSLLRELGVWHTEHNPLQVHLKLNTGMNRLGLEASELPEALQLLRQFGNIRVQSLFSHLVASDDPQHDDFTREQAERFCSMCNTLEAGIHRRPIRHLLNSSGLHRFPEYQFDMVRLGIGLYGLDNDPERCRQLRPAHTLKTTISQIRTVPAGHTIGYSRAGVVHRDSRIATIAIGYADGLLRLAGKGRYQVLIRGQLAPTIGNICMDMTMVDVTHIHEASQGDEVIVFGVQPSINALAQTLQTIPYEVLTNLSQRVKRVFFQES
jgi:alanine racemase